MSSSSSAKRPRAPQGGCRQRAERAANEANELVKPSALARLLLERWAWGDLSGPSIQSIAQAAVIDGAVHEELNIIAKLGSSGAFPANIQRDLLRALQPTPVTNHLKKISIWMRKVPGHIIQVEHDILLPHELFASMYEYYPETFLQRLCNGSVDNLKRFWSAMKKSPPHPAYIHHPMRADKGHESTCIPLALHGDGVPVTGAGRSWQKSLEVYSWCSLLSKGNTLKCNFLIYAMFDKLLVKSGGLNGFDKFSKLLAWSFQALYDGKWPSVDEQGRPTNDPKAGKPLAGGFRGVLFVIRGDLEFMTTKLGLESYNSATPCGCCRANTTDRPWTDGRADAAWRATVWNDQEWAAAHPAM